MAGAHVDDAPSSASNEEMAATSCERPGATRVSVALYREALAIR